jgi:uracil-DNA glycosylase
LKNFNVFLKNLFQAEGLSFSVPRGVPLPRTLKNIYTELESDIDGFKAVDHGCFLDWTKEGVFLLNAILTVR